MLFDGRAIAYVLGAKERYVLPRTLHYVLKSILGEGLLVAEGTFSLLLLCGLMDINRR